MRRMWNKNRSLRNQVLLVITNETKSSPVEIITNGKANCAEFRESTIGYSIKYAIMIERAFKDTICQLAASLSAELLIFSKFHILGVTF